MLTPQEALLFQAVKDEEAAQMSQNAALGLGGIGGALIGTAAGTIPHKIGNAVNKLKRMPQKGIARTLRPGHRMAGGLTGLILGGALGAGMSALMKQESPSAQLLGKIQAQGGSLDSEDERVLGELLGAIYNNPSELM